MSSTLDRPAQEEVLIRNVPKSELLFRRALLRSRLSARLDFRLKDQFRPLNLKIRWPNEQSRLNCIDNKTNISHIDAAFDLKSWNLTAQVDLGETKVECQIGCEIGPVSNSNSVKGVCRINCEIDDSACRYQKVWHEKLSSLSRLLEKVYFTSNALNPESLCIIKNKIAWHINCTVKILKHRGNLIDCASMAMLAALKCFSLPEVEIENDEAMIISPKAKIPVDLPIMHLPLCISALVYEVDESLHGGSSSNRTILYDPTESEEMFSLGGLTLAINNLREVCACHMDGSIFLTPEMSAEFSQQAFKLYKELKITFLQKLDQIKEAHLNERNKRAGMAYKVIEDNLNEKMDICENSDENNKNENIKIENLIESIEYLKRAKFLVERSKISVFEQLRDQMKDNNKQEEENDSKNYAPEGDSDMDGEEYEYYE